MNRSQFFSAVAFTVTFSLMAEGLFAQRVAINSTGALPNASAMLDIDVSPSNDKGLLIPRVSLTDAAVYAPIIGTPVTSLLVYNTNAAMINGAVGYWYWDGTQWVSMGSGGTGSSGWLITGNTGITAANFLGTINNAILKFRTNNIHSGLIDPAGPTYFGYEAGLSSTGGIKNVGIGYQVMKTSTTGNNNTAVGYQAMMTSNSQFNTAVGYYSLTGFTAPGLTGAENTGCGYATLDWLSTGSYNCALGSDAGSGIVTGSRNIAIGKLALAGNLAGSENVAVGDQAMGAFITAGSYNVAVGKNSLDGGNSCTYNTCIGFDADASSSTTNATALGNGAAVTASNSMMFGNTAVIAWGFGAMPSAAQALKVGTGVTNGNGANLTVGGVWTNVSSRILKDNITQLDGSEILNKIGRLEVARWKYKGTDEYHIGPFAEQFYELFNTGINNVSISTVDPSGVALIGVQQLIKENTELKAALAQQELRIKKLEEIMSAEAKK